jgi:Uma2 family endonuclease
MASGNIRVPDVGVIFKQSLPEGKLPDGFGDRAPDLAIEIVSPNEEMPDLMRKVGEYFESGAQEVWLLFPETQRVVRYTAPFEATTLHAADELSTPLAPDFRMRVAELFAVE